MRNNIGILVACGLVGCTITARSEGEESCAAVETPVSQVASPPADEAAVMSTLAIGPQPLLVTWERTLTDPSNDLSVTLTRSPDEAVVSDRGETTTHTCVSGDFLRIPYDATVTVGADAAVGTGRVFVQADDADPPTVFVDTPNSGLESELSTVWSDAATPELPDDVASYEWRMFLNGAPSALNLLIVADYERQDGSNGRTVLWRGDPHAR